MATNVIRTAQKNAGNIRRTVGTALGVGGSASGAAIAGAAAAAIIAGIASYWGTTKLVQSFNNLGSESELADWQLAVTNAWRSARREAETKLDRSLTQSERDALRDQFAVYYKANIQRSIRNLSIRGRLQAGLNALNIQL